MHDFADVGEVEQVLEHLAQREEGPLVVRLAREPGKRESRYRHLFSGDVEAQTLPVSAGSETEGGLEARVSALEHQVASLQQQIDRLLNVQGAE